MWGRTVKLCEVSKISAGRNHGAATITTKGGCGYPKDLCTVGQSRYERELRHFREFPSEQLACLPGLLLVRLQKFRVADAATLGFSSTKPSVSSTGLITRISTGVFRRFWKQYWLSSRELLLRPS